MSLRVLRIYHSAVVTDWRERDRLLRSHGVDVTLVSPRRWNEGGRDVALLPGEDDFVLSVSTLGRHPYGFVYDPLPIVKAMRMGRFDVIDIHEEPASLAAFELSTLARVFQPRVPILFYGAQNIEKRYPPPFRWIERSALRRAAGCYCCNREAAEIFRRKGFRGVARVIGLGVNVERFSPQQDRSVQVDRLTVGYVGRLEHHKGVHVLLDAVADLEEAKLVISGDGPEREVLERQASEVGAADRVQFTGFVPRDELPDLYRSFDLLVVPSVPTPTVVEQFGRVVVEGMAAGLPVVVSDVGSLPEIAGDAGVTVPPGDADPLRTAIAELFASPQRREELGRCAVRNAQEYSWEAIAEAHRELYLEVAS